MILPDLHTLTSIPKISYGCQLLLTIMTVGATVILLLLTCWLLYFPPGHRDRLLTIEQILSRDYKILCLSGGADAEDTGTVPATKDGAAENQNIKQEEKPEEENIDELLAAVADAEER